MTLSRSCGLDMKNLTSGERPDPGEEFA